MKRLPTLLLMICALLMSGSCDNMSVTPASPSTISVPPETPGPPPILRHDVTPNLQSMTGMSAFALAERTESEIRSWITTMQSYGYNTARVCGETWTWGFAPHLPKGSDLTTAISNLRVLLSITAEYPGFNVLLVPICTIRDTHRFSVMREFTERVAQVVIDDDYKHVLFEAVNEHWHPASNVRDDSKVAQLIRILQRTGRDVGTDDNFNRHNQTYNRGLRGLVDFLSVHPWRNPDPTRREIKKFVEKNGGLVVLSETTAYVTDEELAWFNLPNGNLAGRGETSDARRKAQIRAYKEACDSVPGCVWFAHSVEGLHCQTGISWLP